MKKIYTSPDVTVNNYEPAEDITLSGAGGNTDTGWGDIID